ncbi:amidase [Actinoallomurus spadix]|uniref:Amidase n=1 Tax=Actinoallomurus spadix TaxID=79912 RepID=A0ABN0WSS1_9ACTN|nr:amidase [Actinoallomurus spadix]MCO5990153.1 amidase [Actinoallomurus spadix]
MISSPTSAAPRGHFAGRSLGDLAADLRRRRTTATDLARHALDAVARLDPLVNAFTTVSADEALAAARQADRELADGLDRGPLHGIPVAVKDVIMVAGRPVTMGSRHFAGHVPTTDADCVRRLKEAGAVLVGQTTTHEFAYGPTGDRSATGPSRNPRDPGRMSGGSSGGSAVAVAAGMVPLAIGTDTGGSVRIPAALCGTAGFKPAYGVLPTGGVFPLSKTYDHVGLLAASAEDCRIAYHALVTGGRPSAEHASRVGWLDPRTLFPVDARVLRSARTVLESSTGPLDELRVPQRVAEELREAYTAIQSGEAAAVHAERLAERPDLFDPEVLDRLRAAATVPAWRYVRGLKARPRLADAVDALFERHDVLALPTVPIVAPLIDRREVDLDGGRVGVRDALLALTSPWNVLGLPALTVPAGTVDGLPTGLQLICRIGEEHRLFETAARAVPRTDHESPLIGESHVH